MPNPTTSRTTSQIVDQEFLELRARIIQLAASFDRISRADGGPDPRMSKIHEGLEILSGDSSEKAKGIQELFSRPYAESWRSDFGI